MGRNIASDRLKIHAAARAGFADLVIRDGWENATTRQIGLMVREMIRMGEETLLKGNGVQTQAPDTRR